MKILIFYIPYLVMGVTLAGCTSDKPIPKVGECYENYFKSMKEDTYEFRKVIKVNPKSDYYNIKFVYNFPNTEGFEGGIWYTNSLAFVPTSRFLGNSRIEVNKIKCPW